MSQQKKIIYISEEHYNILWNSGAKDGSFTKNGVTYYYDEDATYYVPAPNGGAETPTDPTFNTLVVVPTADSTASATSSGSFVVDETGFIVDYSNVNFSIPDTPNATFTLSCGSWPIITASTSDNSVMGDLAIHASNFRFDDNGLTNPASISFWNGAEIYFGNSSQITGAVINFDLAPTISNKTVATQEYVDNALGDIETLLASI